MQSNFNNERSRRWLGWYQLLAASVGIVLTAMAEFRGGTINPEIIGFAAAPFALVGTAGYRLIRSEPNAVQLTLFGQALQVPIFFLPHVVWKFAAGVVLSVGWFRGTSTLYAGIETTWFFGSHSGPEPSVQINLIPIILIVFLVRNLKSSGRET